MSRLYMVQSTLTILGGLFFFVFIIILVRKKTTTAMGKTRINVTVFDSLGTKQKTDE